jgi:DHA2 family methylenomycin A resistance protein-like MFS transporter
VPSAGALVAVQALLGFGAAVLVPASLALLTRTFEAPAARAGALGVWASTAAVVFAAGPVIAGVVIDLAGWRAVFALNLPFVLAIALLLGPEAPAPGAERRLDVAGQLTAVVALAALTFALIEGVPAAFALALVAGLAFVAVERRAEEPMLPLGLFSAPAFSGAVSAGVLLSVALYGQLFLMSLYLQEARGLSATETGLVFLPQPVMTALTGIPAGRLIGRLGPRAPALAGGALGVAGTLVLTTTGAGTPYLLLIAGLMCIGAAAGLIVPALTTAAIETVPAEHVGVASSAVNAGRQMGAVLGIAILGGLVSEADFVSGLPLAMFL